MSESTPQGQHNASSEQVTLSIYVAQMSTKTYLGLCHVSTLYSFSIRPLRSFQTVSSRAKEFVDLHDQVQVRVLPLTTFDMLTR
jgi:hypothetical protein